MPKRDDIQGMRAIAVAAVVLFHYFPDRLPGGFVGVDVFFVISGFLITGSLLRELGSTGRVHLVAFYSRRFRRLAPAAVVVTIVTCLVAFGTYGALQLNGVLVDAAWSSLGLANVHFSGDVTGYFAEAEKSPFLHFWTLAVEEQFYLIWPVLLLAAWRFGRNGAVAILVLAIIVSSLLVSVFLTSSDPTVSYFSLFTRGWELALGGLLAWLVSRTEPLRSVPANLISLAGLVLIVAPVFWYSQATPFPGWAALIPTLGTALLIWAGTGSETIIGRTIGNRPAAFLGAISYPLYLWHWPVLVLFGHHFSKPDGWDAIGLLLLCLLLATLTLFFVERTAMKAAAGVRPVRLVVIGVTAAALVSGTALGVSLSVPVNTSLIAPTISESSRFPGPVPSSVPLNVSPSLEHLTADLADVFTNGCFSGTDPAMCRGGVSQGSLSIVVVGDSHAGQWWPAIEQASIRHNWRLSIVGRNGCPAVHVEITQGDTADAWPECDAWQRGVLAAVSQLDPDLIVYANNTFGYQRGKVSLKEDFDRKWSLGLKSSLQELAGLAPVLFLGQLPLQSVDPLACLSGNLTNVDECSTPVAQASPVGIRVLSETVARSVPGVTFIDADAVLCTEVCPLVMYDTIVYSDSAHLTKTFAEHMSYWLAENMTGAIQR